MNPLFPVEYILIFLGAATVLGGYLSWRSSGLAPKGVRILMTVLRIAALLILTVIAFDPGIWKVKRAQQSLEWAVMLDTTESMRVEDVGSESRFSAGRKVASKLLKEIEDVNIYPFADHIGSPLNSEEELAKTAPDGAVTGIRQSGAELLKKYHNSAQKLKGIVVISDGRETVENHNDNFAILARAENIPIYGLLLGGKIADKDLSLKLNHTRFTLFKGQSQNITVQLKNSNLGNIKTEVRVVDERGKVLSSRNAEVRNNSTVSLVFSLKLIKPGYHELYIETSVVKGEKITGNNRIAIFATVLDEKLKILMVEGRPFWDSKFLSQVMRDNNNISFTGIYRLSPTRFFSVSEDQKNEKESATVIFPETLEKLAQYNLVIFGKGAEFFLNDRRIALLRRYIRDFGGAVLFARGKPYSGNWNGLESLEPVYWGETLSDEFRWHPTDAGRNYGLFGEMLPPENAEIWQELPLVERASRCPELKSFSEVLMIGKSEQNKLDIPVLISRKIGKGVVVAVNSEGLWKWDFFPLKGDVGDFYRKFWTQLVFWSVKFSDFLPNRNYSLHINRTSVLPGEEVVAFINTREKFNRNLKPVLRIIGDGVAEKRVLPSPLPSGRGWNGVFSLSKPGKYRVLLEIPGKKINGVFATLEVKSPPKESDNLSADRENLKKLAEESGGGLLSASEIIDRLSMPEKQSESELDAEKKWHSTWNRWWLLISLLLCFSVEWYLRRRNGML